MSDYFAVVGGIVDRVAAKTKEAPEEGDRSTERVLRAVPVTLR
jgi:hypothetical protein